MNQNALTPISELKNISKQFLLPSGKEITVLEDISLAVYPGEVLGVLGPSGCGKSTLLRILIGLIKPSSGEVLSYNYPLNGIHKSASMVFQNFALFPWLNVKDNIGIGLDAMDLSATEKQKRIKRAIDLIGLEGFEDLYPRALSGGMKQRVGIARALVVQPELLCMDEPFSGLDVLTAENLRSEVIKLWTDHKVELKSIVFVTHNISEAVFLSNRIVVMSANPGKVRAIITNSLPYPRDYRSSEFLAVVDQLHDIITNAIMPDDIFTPEITRRQVSFESLPRVSVGEIIGMLEILDDSNGKINIFDLALKIGRDFGTAMSVAKAAEMLDFVDTPRQFVIFTKLGKDFLTADVNTRKQLFKQQLLRLRIFQIIDEMIQRTENKELDKDIVLENLAMLLPNEDTEKLFDTIIAWARYAEMFLYDMEREIIFYYN